MTWKDQLNGDSIAWLLEPDSAGARYLALRDLADTDPDDPILVNARVVAHREGPIATILSHMDQEGYWVRKGPGYNPKYRSIVWSLVFLAQLGASVFEDERIRCACDYLMDNSLSSGGQFSMNGAPSGTIDCLQGNLSWAFLELGYIHPRLESAYEWMARSVTGEGVAAATDNQAAIRYYFSKSGPLFSCGYNGDRPCAWGADKVMLAFSKIPNKLRTPLIQNAIQQGIDFLLSTDPALAKYPSRRGYKPSPNWWKFGFPVFYITDLLQNVEVLVRFGYGKDPRLEKAIACILGKQDDLGRWKLEYDYNGKTWVDLGEKDQPNKWVTLRALRVLKAIG